jgi:hypothetical protein
MHIALARRKRLNFMVDPSVAEELNQLIPTGNRSNFVNNAIEQALVRFSREKAYEETQQLREKLNLKIGSDEKLYKIIREGRL